MKFILLSLLLSSAVHAASFTDDFNRVDTGYSTNAADSVGSGYVLQQRAGDRLAEARISGQQLQFNQTGGSTNAADVVLYYTGIELKKCTNTGEFFTVEADITTKSTAANAYWYGLAFNVQADGSFYDARITTGTTGVALQINKRAAGGTVTGFAAGGTVSNSTPLAVSSVYHLTISSFAPGVILYSLTGPNLDGGELSGTATDTVLKLSGGYAGFYTDLTDTTVLMDNLSIESATDDYHLFSGNLGSVATNFYYNAAPPYGDEGVAGWDLISNLTNPITGPWGNKTGLFVPAPYGNYGLGRSSSQPTTFVQMYGTEAGLCLDVESWEVPSETYNPNVKLMYIWNKGYYMGGNGTKTWLYPYSTAYSNSNPHLMCSFEAAVKTSYGSGVRHANTAFEWVDEVSGTIVYVQHYIYGSRTNINDVASGFDAKSGQLWITEKLGSSGCFCEPLEGSAVWTNTVWSDYKYFGIDQSWTDFSNLVSYLNQKHNLNMGYDRNKWRLLCATFNLEMQQGFDGCAAGKVNDFDVWTRY